MNARHISSVSGAALRRSWKIWKVIARRIGVVQSYLFLTLLYVVVVMPFALVVRLRMDRLRLKARAESNWTEADRIAATLDAARRAF